MGFFILFFIAGYTKKKDVKGLLKLQRFLIPIIYLLYFFVALIFILRLNPTLNSLYDRLDKQMSFFIQMIPYAVAGSILILLLYFLATPSSIERLESFLANYNDEDKIRKRDIPGNRIWFVVSPILFELGIVIYLIYIIKSLFNY